MDAEINGMDRNLDFSEKSEDPKCEKLNEILKIIFLIIIKYFENVTKIK
jgi:hypothetical protein